MGLVRAIVEGMYKTPKIMLKHLANNISNLLMVAMGDSGEREAVLMGKYISWGIAYNDFFDPDNNNLDKDATVRVVLDLNLIFVWYFPDDPRFRANLAMNLEGEDAAKKSEILTYVDAKAVVARRFPGTVFDTTQTHPLVKGFGEFWIEVADSAPRQYLLRWSVDNQRYVNSFLKEVNIRKTQDDGPSLQDCILVSRESTTSNSCAVLVSERKDPTTPLDDEMPLSFLPSISPSTLTQSNLIYDPHACLPCLHPAMVCNWSRKLLLG